MVKRLICKRKDEEILFDVGESRVRIEGDGIEAGPLVVSCEDAKTLWRSLLEDGFEER